MLAAVSGGQAGNTPPPTAFQFSVDPEFLTAGQNGFAQGVFTAASGQGQGSATNVKMIFTLPAGFTGGLTGTSSGCTASGQVWTCTIGTVNAGNKVKRFLVYTSSAVSSTPYTLSGCVSLDGGSGGAGGGGGTQTCAQNTKTDTTTVVATSSATRGGNCTGDASTAALSKTNPITTSVDGDASASLGLPCTWSFVGVNNKNPVTDTELVVPQIAFMGFPQTDAGTPVVWTIELAARPSGPFEDLDPLVDKTYTANSTDFNGTEPPACLDVVAPFGVPELPAGGVCVIEFVKVGPGARLKLLIAGTGGDPGNGWG